MSTLERVGLLKTSLVDYPGEIAAVLFTAGCPMRCPYCHNPELVPADAPHDFIPVAEALEFLRGRRSVLTGVCITGGEPLQHGGIPELAAAIHELGLRVKLDTNGMFPDRIAAVGADAIAMDLKIAPDRYREIGGSGERLRRAVTAARATGAALEFRTTVVPGFVSPDDIDAVAALLEPGDRYVLAAFRPGRTLDPAYATRPAPTSGFLQALAARPALANLDVSIRDGR